MEVTNELNQLITIKMGIENGKCNNCGGKLQIKTRYNEDGFKLAQIVKCLKCGAGARDGYPGFLDALDKQ